DHQDSRGGALVAGVPPPRPAGQVLARQYLCPRQLPLPVLRQEGVDQRAHLRPRPAAVAGWDDRMDQYRDVLLPVQPQEGRSHPPRSWHDPARPAGPTELGAGGRDPDLAAVDPGRLARLLVLDWRAR